MTMKINTKTYKATTAWNSCGQNIYYPAYAEAWFDKRYDEAVSVQDSKLELWQMEEKAVAILRNRRYSR